MRPDGEQLGQREFFKLSLHQVEKTFHLHAGVFIGVAGANRLVEPSLTLIRLMVPAS